MAGVTRQSMKSLWVLISGNTILKSEDIVGTELERNSDKILNGILFYKEPTPETLEEFKKENQEGMQLEFIQKLSLLLNLAESQCYQLFCLYLKYEFKGTQANIKTFFGSERHIQTLLYDLWKFYYSERLYSLVCLKHVLIYWQDSSHPYKELYEGFLESINKDGAVIQQVIKQLESLAVVEVPNRFSHGQYLTDSLLHHWVSSTLQEQCELLQILLFYYKDMEPTPEDFLRLLLVFQKNSFGEKLPCRQHAIETSQVFMDYIGFLQILILLEGMEIEWLYSCQERKIREDHFLLKDEQVMKKMDGIICTLGNHPQHGPLLLGWLLVRTCVEEGEASDLANKRLGNTALQLDAFRYLAKGLASPLQNENETTTLLAHKVVYQLLSVLFSAFELGTLGNIESLFDLGEKVLQFDHIAKDMWEKGTDKGVGLLLKEAALRFPLQSSPLLKLTSSLAKANVESCLNVLASIKHLPAFVEYLEETNPREVRATPRDSVWQLVRNRYPYSTETVVIPKGTIGIILSLSDRNGHSVIQWQKSVNGWQIFLCKISEVLTRMSEGIGNVTFEMITLIVEIASLVSSVLQTDPSAHELLVHVADALCDVFERFTLLPSPPTNLIGAYLELAASLSLIKPLPTWQKLSQLNFLPFMTGTSDLISQLASGAHTSMALFGQLVAAKECVVGEYSIVLAFLKLVSSVVGPLVEEDNPVFLACLVYVLREVFPVYQRWRYVHVRDKEKIGEHCLTIFHKLFSTISTEGQKELRKSQAISIYSFLNFEAGASLLQIVSTGEHTINQAYEQLGSPLIGSASGLVSVIRLSLSVLNRVLLFKNRTKTDGPSILADRTGTLPGMKLSTPLEVALFSSPTERSQPHMVLNVARYAFQRYDPRLATLSVQLLKRFAKEFPMSLLACLGSDAEAIRDLFLMRLEAVTEDVRLKVAIVEFLSVCITCQPGLMEMFVNASASNGVKPSEKTKVEDSESCLQIMLDILEEKKKNVCYCPLELHCAVVEFIHSLWAAQHMLAIETLKKNTSLWSLLCDPLLKTQMEDTNPKVAAHIVRTIALEVFHAEVFERGKIDQPLESVFKEITSRHLLCTWSKYVASALPSPVDLDVRSDVFDASLSNEKSRDSFALLAAWRDFLVVVAKAEPFRLSDDKSTILEDILNAISLQMSNPGNSKVLIILCELYLVLLQKWSRDGIPAFGKWVEALGALLKDVAISKDNLHPRLQLAVISIVTTALHILKRNGSEEIDLSDWVLPVCVIVKNIMIGAEKLLKEGQTASSLQLPIVAVCLLKELLMQVGDSSAWLPVLHQHSILDILVALLLYTVERQRGISLAHAILTFFLMLATVKQSAESLHVTGVVYHLNLILATTYKSPGQSSTLYKANAQEPLTWVNIYHLVLQLVTSLLQTLKHFFVEDALNVVGVHLERLHYILQQVRMTPHTQEVKEAIITCWFVHHVSFHEKSWRIHHPTSLPILMGDLSEACHAAIAYLIKPKLLLILAEHLKAEHPSDKKESPKSQEHDGRKLRRLSSIEEVDKPTPVFTQVQTRLLQLLAIGLSTLQKLSPSLYDLLSDQGVDVGQWQLILHVNFSTPAVEPEGPLCFGTILSCVNMCLQTLFKVEWTSSPVRFPTSDSPVLVERQLMFYILETCLTLLISQATISRLSPALTSREKQLVSRELRTELGSIMVAVNRFLRKGAALSPAGSSSTSLSSPGQGQFQNLLYDKSFIELVSHLVDNCFK